MQDLEVVNIPPRMKVYETPDNTGYLYITQAMKVLQVNSDGKQGTEFIIEIPQRKAKRRKARS